MSTHIHLAAAALAAVALAQSTPAASLAAQRSRASLAASTTGESSPQVATVARPPTVAPSEVEVAAILAAAEADADVHAEPMALALAKLGSRAIPAMFEALATRLPADAAGSGEPRPIVVQRRALERGLCQLPMPILHGFIERAAEGALSIDQRLAMLRVLSRCGSALDLPLLVALAGPPGEDGTGRVASHLQRAVAVLLARDSRAYGMIDATLRGQSIEVQTALLSAVAEVGTDEGLKTLARLLERHPTLRLFLLNLIGRMSAVVAKPIDETVLAEVRNPLIERDAEILPEAILACGQLDDFDAAPYLVALVKDRRRNVSANAIWSLQRMTGLRFKDDNERWRTWLDTEMGWWRDRSASVLAALGSGKPERVKTALLEIAKQHTFRHQLAEAVTAAVEHSEPDVVLLACGTLGQLDSRVAVPFLIQCLEHPDARVRSAALASLRSITQKNYPESAEAWREAMRSPRAPSWDEDASSDSGSEDA